MHVKFSYLDAQFANPDPILADIRALVQSGDFTLGKPVEKFEKSFAAVIGAKYGIGVNSGTDALFLALKAIGVGAGDEVITMPSTFIATVGAIVATGARPVFVDITDEYTIDPSGIQSAITTRTKALLPVHWAGHPADMPEIMAIAQDHGLPVIEDACQAIGAQVDGKTAGTFGEAGCFSLHPLKNLNVWGDGGIIVTDSEVLHEQLRLLRNHGLKDRDHVSLFGYNSRLDSLQAVVGNRLIKEFDFITERRIAIAERLDRGLADLSNEIRIPKRRPNKRYVFHLYIVQAEDRDGLLAFLLQNGIEAKVHYPMPLHLQEASRSLGYQAGDFPVAEAQAKKIITLPAHQHLSDAAVDYMIQKVHAFYAG